MMVEWKCCEKCRGTKDNPTICMACPDIKIEAEEKLAEKDKEIERLKEMLIEERALYMTAKVNSADVDWKEVEKEARAEIEKELKK